MPCLFIPLQMAFADLQDSVDHAWSVAVGRSEEAITWMESNYTNPQIYSKYPSVANYATGEWMIATTNGDWRNGFWPGVLWMISQKSGSEVWKQRATNWSAPLGPSTSTDHDIGFIVLGSLGKGWLYHDDISDPGGTYRSFAKSVLVDAATKLNARFNQAVSGVPVPAGFTRSWNHPLQSPYPVCIDNLMNLEAMFLAYEMNGRRPENRPWFDRALIHARSSIAKHMRPDGSTYHVVRHIEGGPQIGEVERKKTFQGYAHESTWSRGQTWAIYGFTAAYRHARRDPGTDASDLLAAAKAAADYYLSRLPHVFVEDSYNSRPNDFVPPSDFDAALGEPIGPWNDSNDDFNWFTRSGLGDRKAALMSFTTRDSSAAAVAASGLIELSSYVQDPADKVRYLTAAENMLDCLINYDGPDVDSSPDYLCAVGESSNPGILKVGTVRWNEPPRSLIYGDYYFLEALARYDALQARKRLVETQMANRVETGVEFGFQIRTSAPALAFRVQRSDDPAGTEWTTIAAKTGAGAWSGIALVSEELLPGNLTHVKMMDPSPGERGFFRILTRSIGGGE